MRQAQIGIIGGTGLGDILAKEAGGEPVEVETPFGPPSSPPIVANWEGVDVAFIARHGEGHLLNPSEIPYRANIMALKMLGVTSVLASGATGSLRESVEPAQLVVCDQVIDKTFRRPSTFFGRGLAVHVEMADPFCPTLRQVLIETSEEFNFQVHHAGTYICMEGPQFSTRAESAMHCGWGGDVIGMTAMPEAKLAREAELCYAMVALVTDYDCWRPHSATLEKDALLSEIRDNLQRAGNNAVALIKEAVKRIRKLKHRCYCRGALKLAVWSDKAAIDADVREQLRPLIGRYLS